jgi:hypothetical protein
VETLLNFRWKDGSHCAFTPQLTL